MTRGLGGAPTGTHPAAKPGIASTTPGSAHTGHGKRSESIIKATVLPPIHPICLSCGGLTSTSRLYYISAWPG